MKKIIKSLFILLVIALLPGSIFAETVVIEPKGAQCPSCGSMSVNVAPGYTTDWLDYEPDYCIHGYENGYDMGQLRFTYGNYKKCSNCGWESSKTILHQEGRRICYGY